MVEGVEGLLLLLVATHRATGVAAGTVCKASPPHLPTFQWHASAYFPDPLEATRGLRTRFLAPVHMPCISSWRRYTWQWALTNGVQMNHRSGTNQTLPVATLDTTSSHASAAKGLEVAHRAAGGSQRRLVAACAKFAARRSLGYR